MGKAKRKRVRERERDVKVVQAFFPRKPREGEKVEGSTISKEREAALVNISEI